MNNLNVNKDKKMLTFRTMLCFAENENCTVTSIAKKLNVEKYQISRILNSLEKEDIVKKDDKGVPSLTVTGEKFIKKYQDKVDVLVSFLLRSGIDPAYSKDVALHIAGNANDKIMDIIMEKELQFQIKDTLKKQARLTGATFSKKVKSGSYTMPLVTLCEDEGIKGQAVFECFLNKAVLNIVGNKGNLQLRQGEIPIKNFEFLEGGEYIRAERVGEIYIVPTTCLNFVQMGYTVQNGLLFLGIANGRITLEVEGKQIKKDVIMQVLF